MDYDKELFAREWKEAEGERLQMYRCPAGYLSIGRGHNLETGKISLRVSQAIFEDDLEEYEREVVRRFPWVADMTPARQAAFLELAMNMGIGNRSRGLLTFHDTLPHMQAGQWYEVAEGLRGSKWFRDVGPIRGNRVVQMFVTGQYPGAQP